MKSTKKGQAVLRRDGFKHQICAELQDSGQRLALTINDAHIGGSLSPHTSRYELSTDCYPPKVKIFPVQAVLI
jgi:hypothetical protein